MFFPTLHFAMKHIYRRVHTLTSTVHFSSIHCKANTSFLLLPLAQKYPPCPVSVIISYFLHKGNHSLFWEVISLLSFIILSLKHLSLNIRGWFCLLLKLGMCVIIHYVFFCLGSNIWFYVCEIHSYYM